ncbi:hypothetical protein ED328_16090, partial [Muribaculaceae bacterium Isolate-001 (NCI)]
MWRSAFRLILMLLSLQSSSERWKRRSVMWGLEQGLRLWVCQRSVSMRYGIRGLTQMVWSWKGHSPASGDVYVFFSKDRKTMK